LPATIARLEAYSIHLQNKKTADKIITKIRKDQRFDY
jgi:hypothetical protein